MGVRPRYVNGDILACKRTLKEVMDELVDIHRFRWFKYIRKIVLEFQDFIQFLYFNVGGSLPPRPCVVVMLASAH